MLEGAALARHYGFGDGLRAAFGRPPVYLDTPVVYEFHEAYFAGMEEGRKCGIRTLTPPPKSFLLRWFGWLL